MITRGKFLSFTMINWNGFFARTFELDQMVTTLSGGNGAGKSTSMAALITALILIRPCCISAIPQKRGAHRPAAIVGFTVNYNAAIAIQ